MILISLSRRRRQRHLLALVTAAAFLAVPCFAETMLLPIDSTPYDGQMTRVSQVLHSEAGPRVQRTSMAALNSWIGRLRAMPYRYSQWWRTPREVNRAKVGDCKGKAVALYEKMREHGARNVRLVIGKRRMEDARTHAWVEWETMQGTFLLDPTFNWTAAKTDERDSTTYVPIFAYDGLHKYRALNFDHQYAGPYALSTQVASHE